MSNFVKQIDGVFTIKYDGREHPNLVVNTGLVNTFRNDNVFSLCDTLAVYNDESEVIATDTEFENYVATTSNVTSVNYGISGTSTSDYFYMKKTWTFTQGQIDGVITKLAVYSDNGELYASALLRTPDGELDPIRPLLAPKVEITYESRWHFKQSTNFTVGTPVKVSDTTTVNVRTNMADKNNKSTYDQMNKPFKVLGVELYADAITTDEYVPTDLLAVVDDVDYTSSYIDSVNGVYGQNLKLILPRNKYINDRPIATILFKTTRGSWQMGFDTPLEKPTLSKREIELNVPFIHGVLSDTGVVEPTGDPEVALSIFTDVVGSTTNVSARTIAYDDVHELKPGLPGYHVRLKDSATKLTLVVPETDSITVAIGQDTDFLTYLRLDLEVDPVDPVSHSGITLHFKNGSLLTGFIDDEIIDADQFIFSAGDVIEIRINLGAVVINSVDDDVELAQVPALTVLDETAHIYIGVVDAELGSVITVY